MQRAAEALAQSHSPRDRAASCAESAVERHSVGDVLDAGFHCRISGSEASRRMKEAVANRRQALDDVARIGTPPAAATHAVTLLGTALRHSIQADADYRNGFGYAARGPCPPTSGYFTAAAQEDRQATRAKIRFVAAFNPLAHALRPQDMDGGRDLRRVAAAIAVSGVRPRGAARAAARDRAAPAHRREADPVRAGPARRDARVREAPLRRRQLAARAPARDRRALHGVRQLRLRVRDVRLERVRTSASSPASARTS